MKYSSPPEVIDGKTTSGLQDRYLIRYGNHVQRESCMATPERRAQSSRGLPLGEISRGCSGLINYLQSGVAFQGSFLLVLVRCRLPCMDPHYQHGTKMITLHGPPLSSGS